MPVLLTEDTAPMLTCHGRITKNLPVRNGEWLIVCVKYQQERVLANELRARRISYFLPMASKQVYASNRLQEVRSPVFPGFLFCHGPFEVRYEVANTRRSWRFISVNEQWLLIRDLKKTLEAIERKDVAYVRTIPNVTRGQLVTITDGPFKGFSGTATEVRSSSEKGLQRVYIDIPLVGVSEFSITNDKLSITTNQENS